MRETQSTSVRANTITAECCNGSNDVEGSRVSVREAAEQLGKSTSTVYRFDRKNGPFGFLKEGRRLFIDARSFGAYLANLSETNPAPPSEGDSKAAPASEPVTGVPQEQITGNQSNQPTQPILGEPPATKPIAKVEGPQTEVPQRQSSGQRPLVLRARPPAIVIFYSW